jgi:Xaa-Pro aminopeptidase
MQDSVQTKTAPRAIPFDTAKLDRLMEEAGLDVLLATSKHNVQYMLDAERAIFFDYMDALGISRYLPVVIYAKGAPHKAGYVGHRLETHQREIAPPWVPELRTSGMAARTRSRRPPKSSAQAA